MARRMSAFRRAQMIRDIVEARHDLTALAAEYGLTPDQMAAWIDEPKNRRVLRGLCVLADLQAQVLLSRYRMLAVSRLIKLATSEGEGDVARRACVDLLRADMKRADGVEERETEEASDVSALREAIYGQIAGQNDDARPEQTDGREGEEEVLS